MAEADRPLVQNAADPRQVRHARRKEKRNREEELADLTTVLSDPVARRVLWRVVSYCGVFGEVFDDASHRTAFNAGVRNVGLFLVNEITAANETAFFLMMKEARAREASQGVEAEAIRTDNSEGAQTDET